MNVLTHPQLLNDLMLNRLQVMQEHLFLPLREVERFPFFRIMSLRADVRTRSLVIGYFLLDRIQGPMPFHGIVRDSKFSHPSLRELGLLKFCQGVSHRLSIECDWRWL